MSDQDSSTPSGNGIDAVFDKISRKEETISPKKVAGNSALGTLLQLFGASILAGMLLIAIGKWDAVWFENEMIVVHAGPTLLFVFFLLLYLSIKKAPADERVGTYFYDMALSVLESGPNFVPVFLQQRKSASRKVQEFQCPGEPEQIQKGSGKVTLEQGKVRPILVTTKGGEGDEALDSRMTLEVNFVVQYWVIDIFTYVANFGDDAEIQRQLRDICEGIISEIAAVMTPAQLVENLGRINKVLDDVTRARFEGSGVEVLSVRMISPELPERVSIALANAAAAKADSKGTRTDADARRYTMEQEGEGEKAKIIAQGEGNAAAKFANFKAEAEGVALKKKALGNVSGEAMLIAEVGEAAANNANLILGLSNATADTLGLFKGIEVIRQTQQPNPKEVV